MSTISESLKLHYPKSTPPAPSMHLGIRGRLFLGFAAMAGILLLAIIFIMMRVSLTEASAKRVINIDLPAFNSAYDLDVQITASQNAALSYSVTHDPAFTTEFARTWKNTSRLILALDNYMNNNSVNTAYQWIEIKNLLQQIKSTQENLMAASAVDSQNILKSIALLYNKLDDIIDGPINANGERGGGIFDEQYKLLQTGAQQIITDMDTIRLIEYILITVSIFLSVFIAILTAHRILTPLNNAITIAKKIASGERKVSVSVSSNDETGQLLHALSNMQKAIIENETKLQQSETHTRKLFERIVKTAHTFSKHSSNIASGNLTKRITVDSSNEMSQLGNDLNAMTDNLSTITRKITEACANMVVTIEEVKRSIEVQSTGATEQASSINEITASLDEIEKSSNQTIDKAKSLGDVAERTREKGQMGLEAVNQSILGMKLVREKVQTIAQTILDLSNQTQQVGEITSVVNTLAQQSKMLALNASIEAAKAGEAGKGFAVVASEVKTLAEQSEQSTAQVQKILENIRRATEKAVMVTEEGTKGVDEGMGLVEQTGDIVRSLSDVIDETSMATQQIAAAIRQEGIGIEQITAGMNEINQVTASFVDSVKQTTEAINNLAIISKDLKQHVDIYKI